MEGTLRSTELLRADHRDVLSRLDALQRAVDVRNGTEAVKPIIEETAAFFKTRLWTLIWKEEDALFPAVKPFLPRKASAITQMRREHAELRKANERFQSAVAVYRTGSGNGETMTAVREASAQIVSLLKHHIPAEDGALLAVADTHLGEQQDQRLLETFRVIEADLAWSFQNLEEFHP